jgi:hypothetical protein
MKQKDGAVVKSDLELSDAEMTRRLQEKQAAKVEQCRAEMQAVLNKYGMTLQVIQVTVDGQPMRPEIRVVPAPQPQA